MALTVQWRSRGKKEVSRCNNCGAVADAWEHCQLTGHDVRVVMTKTVLYAKRDYAAEDERAREPAYEAMASDKADTLDDGDGDAALCICPPELRERGAYRGTCGVHGYA